MGDVRRVRVLPASPQRKAASLSHRLPVPQATARGKRRKRQELLPSPIRTLAEIVGMDPTLVGAFERALAGA